MANTIGGVSLGTVTGCRSGKAAGLKVDPIPTQDSNGAIVTDVGGVERNVDLQGYIVGTTVAVLKVDPIPTQDSNGAIVTDVGGVERNVDLQGYIVGTTVAVLKAAYEAVEALIDGSQNAGVTLNVEVNSTTFLSKTVKLRDFTWSITEDEFFVLSYKLDCVESSG